MAFARQITVPEPQGSTTSATPSTKPWNYALSYVGRKVSRDKPAQLVSTTVVASTTSTSSQAVGPSREALQPYAAIYDYFSQPAHALLHPVSAIEHYWALRAARAEALLGAHMVHKQELDNVSAAHEQRRSVSPCTTQSVSQSRPHETSQREIADLIAKYDRDYAHIRRMVVSSSRIFSSTASKSLTYRTRTVDTRGSACVRHGDVFLPNLPPCVPKLSIGWPAWYRALHHPRVVTIYFSRK